MKRKGFSLVELLVTIAIIGLLSTVAVVALSASRSKAKTTKARADVGQYRTTIVQAQQINNSCLQAITQSTCTYCACGGDIRNISESSGCAQTVLTALNRIRTAIGAPNLLTVPRDPWLSPYLLDENECENGSPDLFWSAGGDGLIWSSDDIRVEIPKFGP